MSVKLTLLCVSIKYKCQCLLVCLKVCMSEISAKSDKLLLSYSNLFPGPLFIWTQCSSKIIVLYYQHVESITD